MKLSKKGEYAIRALIDFGIAAEVGRSLVQVTELAAHEKLPVKFLEQIMMVLKEAGLTDSLGRIRRWDGWLFSARIGELGHSTLGFGTCKCRSGADHGKA